jgi:hypothetical protein
MRHQLLDLEGVHLAQAIQPFQEDQYRIAGFVVGHGCGWNGIGGDVLQVREGEARHREREGRG